MNQKSESIVSNPENARGVEITPPPLHDRRGTRRPLLPATANSIGAASAATTPEGAKRPSVDGRPGRRSHSLNKHRGDINGERQQVPRGGNSYTHWAPLIPTNRSAKLPRGWVAAYSKQWLIRVWLAGASGGEHTLQHLPTTAKLTPCASALTQATVKHLKTNK